jgi:hypothetical protein
VRRWDPESAYAARSTLMDGWYEENTETFERGLPRGRRPHSVGYLEMGRVSSDFGQGRRDQT